MTLAPPPLDPSNFLPQDGDVTTADVVFATFFVSPGINPDDYHSLRPDMRFARVLRKSHAHLKVHVAVLTDSATKLGGLGSEKDDDEGGSGIGETTSSATTAASSSSAVESSSVEIFRCARIERSRMGRNSYCNYAQMIAQIDYLESLSSLCAAAGRDKTPPVVFLDTDILVVGSIVERVFGRIKEESPSSVVPFGVPSSLGKVKTSPSSSSTSDFDYCCTLSDSYDMPINFGIQFVAPGKTRRAAEFLKGVCSIYNFDSTFVAGQEAIAEFMGVMLQPQIVRRRRAEARERGISFAKTPCGNFEVAFVLCDTFNYCKCDQSCCVDPDRGSEGIPKSAEEFLLVPVLAAHFVGHRKPGFDVCYAAFERGGPLAVFEAMAALPNKESEYKEIFGAEGVKHADANREAVAALVEGFAGAAVARAEAKAVAVKGAVEAAAALAASVGPLVVPGGGAMTATTSATATTAETKTTPLSREAEAAAGRAVAAAGEAAAVAAAAAVASAAAVAAAAAAVGSLARGDAKLVEEASSVAAGAVPPPGTPALSPAAKVG